MDVWLLWHEESAHHHRRHHQRHTPRHGAAGCPTHLWRTAQYVAMDRCGLRHHLFLYAQLGREKEGIDFKHNKWIWFAVTASLLGAVSALYDKALMRQLDNMLVQAWCNVYIMLIMCCVMFVLWYPKRKEQPFQWRWTILLISLFLTVADFAYFKALSEEGSMISIVSMVRRGNVIISFLCGALFLREKNIKSKLIALAMVLIGLVFLYFGTR